MRMLSGEEKQQEEFWNNHLPEVIVSQFRKRKEMVKTKEVKEVEEKLDKTDKLEPYLDQQKMRFDERYGTKTIKDNMCLFCSKERISIVSSCDRRFS
jgi:hypothetical protein